ncbi:iron ABC transporter permease [Conexibacter sp. CPCC 206217]|uniref:FecCD family ABC transporter permease n=1 Tax=Conexibacter sp. CPCC 206217 TaxID=3064574 RepID=UPI00271D8C03|nr:iron ABC transporter permease [Conexibacter sp. CPCC 206217]MDO8210481.1 iron ABC transporter permease [Conexibacter sp. CPCC 206217]
MKTRQIAVVVVAATALVVAAIASMTLGAVHVPLSTVIDALTGQAEPGPLKKIVLDLRLPRTVEALAVGSALGVAGALLQGALANPLASPDVMGVTGGAAFGAMLILIIFPDTIALLPLGALGMGLVAALLVFLIASTGANGGSIARLVLAGIAMTAAFQAGTTSIMAAYPDRVQSAIFFLAGGLTTSGWSNLEVVWPYLTVGFLMAVVLTRPLDRLALGDDVAASLGARPRVIRLTAAIAAAILAACGAAIAGLVTFLGLFVPHVVRMASGTSTQTYVVPVSALVGGAVMMAGDTLARTIAAPLELPVGPLMVLLGVPLFLYLLRKAA